MSLAGAGRGGQGIPEGAVEGRGVLCSVGHDRHVGEALGIQGAADGTHAAVHHVCEREQQGQAGCGGGRLGAG